MKWQCAIETKPQEARRVLVAYFRDDEWKMATATYEKYKAGNGNKAHDVENWFSQPGTWGHKINGVAYWTELPCIPTADTAII